MQRWQLYLVVGMMGSPLVVSPWWLGRYLYGPVEWLWRWLTYGTMPALKRP